MTIIPIAASAQTHPNLRPLNVLRDLSPVADLIETCFSSTMDQEGRQYLQEMRRSGNSFARWASRAVETTSLPLTGYVWEENGKIVGNVSLIPFRSGKKRIYLIANVAAHPDYRRRGIAWALTRRAVEHAREKNVGEIWLHVRDDNPGAFDLYRKLGFIERARRTSWQARAESGLPVQAASGIVVAGGSPADWRAQQAWLSMRYPDILSWHRGWSFHLLRPGVWNWLHRFFAVSNIRQWTALKGGELQAALAWMPNGNDESLFAAAGEESDPQALTALLLRARRDLSRFYSSVALEFPSGRFDDAIRAAGFNPLRTLIWMQATS